MTSSFKCEHELRKLIERLSEEAEDLRRAADTLKTLRENGEHLKEIRRAKRHAKDWIAREVVIESKSSNS